MIALHYSGAIAFVTVRVVALAHGWGLVA